MSIIRAPRPDSGFYVLDKTISEDRRLSWAARGLLIFLLGKPDHWRVSTQHLINETVDSGKPLGRDGVRGLIDELIKAGYLRRTLARADAGKLGGYDYEVSEVSATPEPEKPATAQPAPEKPSPAGPSPANPPLVKTDFKQELRGARTDGASAAPSAAVLPDWLPAEAWAAFVEMRKTIKAPLTADAAKMVLSKLERMRAGGVDAVAALNESTMNSWRGVFWPKKGAPFIQAAPAAGQLSAAAEGARRLLGFGSGRDSGEVIDA